LIVGAKISKYLAARCGRGSVIVPATPVAGRRAAHDSVID
jgi:hypothetical protein